MIHKWIVAYIINGYIINRYLEDYVEQIVLNQIETNRWLKDIMVYNVRLRPNEINDSNVPFAILTGCIEKLHIERSTSYAREPIKVEISGFYLLLGPRKEKGDEQKWKSVESIERFRTKKANDGKVHIDEKMQAGFHRVQTFIVSKKLQVSIADLNICYQDHFSKRLNPFRCGLIIDLISFDTTNNHSQGSNTLNKFVQIKGVSTYWEQNIQLDKNLSNEDIIKKLKSRVLHDCQTKIQLLSKI